MALIENAKPKEVSGAYVRLFDNVALGSLLSKVHSTVISSGSELERLIADLIQPIPDLDLFLEQQIMEDGVFLVRKNQMKNSKKLDFEGSEPDFIIFKRRNNKQHCYIVELKDGHAFDTKKAQAEQQSMQDFIGRNAQHLPYVVSAHFCAFNQEDRGAILAGFKNKIAPEEAMTGREFCDLLEIDYDHIVKVRRKHGSANLDYFCRELLEIEDVARRLKPDSSKSCDVSQSKNPI